MKSSGKEARRRSRSRQCIIVDGYNVVAQMHKSGLDEVEDFDAARDALLGLLKEFRSYTGDDVIVVFDAHNTKQPRTELVEGGVRVIYTSNLETADEQIERLVYEFKDVYQRILVATSDYAEQQVIFGGGALRVSAREFIAQLRTTKRSIRKSVEEHYETTQGKLFDNVRQDVANILEKWRRQ